jgi:RNA polymerase sigma-70 factor (ECF subfamily)
LTKKDFKDLFDSHFDKVRNYIYYRSGDTELATDIAQDTFLKIWEKYSDIDDNKELTGLLFKIAHDLFISNFRREMVITRIKVTINESVNDTTPLEILQFEELKNKYEKTINKLPENQKVVFLMSRIDKLKYREIADAVNISVKAVEKRMKGALDFLKKELNY